MKPLLWMRAVRDLGELPAARLAVLWALALRMDAKGAGFAGNRTLAHDAKVSQDTVKRATKWARNGDWLMQVQRGHRITNGRIVASRWQLTTPAQGVTGDVLSDSQGVTRAPLATDPMVQNADPMVHQKPTKRSVYQEISQSPLPVPNGSRPASTVGGRDWKTHEHEPNARAALARIRAERRLPWTETELLDLAYEIGPDPYYDGYRAIDHATEASFDGARNPTAVLRKRLRLT